ncbi:MAG: DNA polymerase IV [Candidatus Omnitrophota bacterium]
MILHIDMDAFFASVEQAINPALKDKPLIVGSRNNKYHTVVCAASYEAKRLGIDSGMSTKEAFSICPEAEFITSNSAKYLYVSEQIFGMLKAYPCDLEHSTIDEFDLEFASTQRLDCVEIAKEVKERIKQRFQITCSIGIAPNWQLAKLGSKIGKPDGLTLINQSNYLAILTDLPIEKVCGIGPALTAQLNTLGIKTCGQLIEYPRNILINKFGKVGLWLVDCLNPQISPIKQKATAQNQNLPKSVGHSYTLPRETSNPYIIQGWIRLLSEMVGQRLRKLNLQAQTICLWLNSNKNRGFSKRKTFQIGIWLSIDIFMRSMAILGLKKGQRISVRAIGLSVSGLKLRSLTPLLEKEKIEENIAFTTDRINAKFGDWTIYPAILSQIHRTAGAQSKNT